MYCISQFCRICVKNDGSLIDLHSCQGDSVTFYDKLRFCRPEIDCEQTSILSFICGICCKNLQKTYDFLRQCLTSEYSLRSYITQLERASSFSKFCPGNLSDLLEKNEFELQARTQNPCTSENVNFHKIDFHSIKVEPSFETDDEPMADYDPFSEHEGESDQSNTVHCRRGYHLPENSSPLPKQGQVVFKSNYITEEVHLKHEAPENFEESERHENPGSAFTGESSATIKQETDDTTSSATPDSKRIMGKVDQRKWSPTSMTKAIDAVRKKEMSFKKASQEFNVPKTTLTRLSNLKYGSPEEAATTRRGRPTVLSKDLEEELVHYCLAMKACCFGLSYHDLRRLAVQLAERNNIEHPFKDEIAGEKWIKLFRKRHKTKLPEEKPNGTTYNKSLGFNKGNCEIFYNLLEDVYRKGNFTPDRIYSVDESGFAVKQFKPANVIAFNSKEQISTLTQETHSTLISIVACMNASGLFIPPLIIFPRKNLSEELKRGAPPGSIFAAHPSGWVQASSFTQWFKHFIHFTGPTTENPVLLILDGHLGQTQNIDLIDLARSNHVTIVSLPPRCSFRLKPLGNFFIGLLKACYTEEIGKWLTRNGHTASAADLTGMFGRAYARCRTAQMAAERFKATGIYPLQKMVFSAAEYIEEENKNQVVLSSFSTIISHKTS